MMVCHVVCPALVDCHLPGDFSFGGGGFSIFTSHFDFVLRWFHPESGQSPMVSSLVSKCPSNPLDWLESALLLEGFGGFSPGFTVFRRLLLLVCLRSRRTARFPPLNFSPFCPLFGFHSRLIDSYAAVPVSCIFFV